MSFLLLCMICLFVNSGISLNFLFYYNQLIHSRSIVDFVIVVFATTYKVCIEFRMLLAIFFCLFQAHDHECCGVCVGCGAIFGYDRCRENAVLDGISQTRVNGVGISLTVFIIKFSVISGCSHRCIGDLKNRL